MIWLILIVFVFGVAVGGIGCFVWLTGGVISLIGEHFGW